MSGRTQRGVLAPQSIVYRRSDRMVPNMLNTLVGAKYISIARTWVPNLVGWGTVAGVGLIHFTDWRLILDYIPYINGKFKDD